MGLWMVVFEKVGVWGGLLVFGGECWYVIVLVFGGECWCLEENAGVWRRMLVFGGECWCLEENAGV